MAGVVTSLILSIVLTISLLVYGGKKINKKVQGDKEQGKMLLAVRKVCNKLHEDIRCRDVSLSKPS